MELDPFDGFLKLIANLVAFVQYREQYREKRYKLIVQPIFESLADVHDDYVKMLTAAKATLDETKSLGAAFEAFDGLRMQKQAKRHELIHRCDFLYHSKSLDDCKDFIGEVKSYFTCDIDEGRRLSDVREQRFIRGIASGEEITARESSRIAKEIRLLKAAWEKVSISHAKALEACL
jgi:hypothetical protein